MNLINYIGYVVNAILATTVAQEGVGLSTVERFMPVYGGLGIDKAEVELEAPEISIWGGSSEPLNLSPWVVILGAG